MNTLLGTNFILASAAMEPRLFDLDLQLLADVVLMAIAVFALFLVLSNKLFNPAREFLKKRQEKIQMELEETKANQIEAAELKATYEVKLKDIDKEAEEILSDARRRALANENKIIADAKEEAARIIERANVEAELEKKKVADDVKKEIISVATIMAQKVVTASMNATVQNEMLDDTLKEIGDSTWLS